MPHAILMRSWTLLRRALIGMVLMAPALSFAEQIPFTGDILIMSHNTWKWTFVDDAGKPIPDVMVFQPRFAIGAFISTSKISDALAAGLKIKADKLVICRALEDWVRQNPEPLELAQSTYMYTDFLPPGPSLLDWADANGQRQEERDYGSQIHGGYRLFFKPGFYPVALYFDYRPPLASVDGVEVHIKMREWPERMQSLALRPWVGANMALQKAMSASRTTELKKSKGGGSLYPAKPIFGRDPLQIWEAQLSSLRDQALKQKANRDAAWLTLATGFFPQRTASGVDDTGQSNDLEGGRVYLALDRAAQLAPEITVLSGNKALRDFKLRFPNGLSRITFLTYTEILFNQQATWTRAELDDYFRTLAPYEQDPMLVLWLTSQLTGRGLLYESAPTLVHDFFRHRTALRKQLMALYPTVSWHEVGLDRWDTPYYEVFSTPYELDAANAGKQ